MVGVAVNVKLLPAQILEAEGETETEGTNIGLTIIVMVADSTFIGLAQLAELVSLTLTTSPFTSVLELKVFPVKPACGTPFTRHS